MLWNIIWNFNLKNTASAEKPDQVNWKLLTKLTFKSLQYSLPLLCISYAKLCKFLFCSFAIVSSFEFLFHIPNHIRWFDWPIATAAAVLASIVVVAVAVWRTTKKEICLIHLHFWYSFKIWCVLFWFRLELSLLSRITSNLKNNNVWSDDSEHPQRPKWTKRNHLLKLMQNCMKTLQLNPELLLHPSIY